MHLTFKCSGLEASSLIRGVRYALQRLQGTDAVGDGLLVLELWTCRAAGICGSIEFTICPHARVVTSSKLPAGNMGELELEEKPVPLTCSFCAGHETTCRLLVLEETSSEGPRSQKNQ